MARIKQKRKIIHEPSTHEIFTCLLNAKQYSALLLANTDKPYSVFLKWLVDRG